jgi:hypothetical protein
VGGGRWAVLGCRSGQPKTAFWTIKQTELVPFCPSRIVRDGFAGMSTRYGNGLTEHKVASDSVR